jgi:pimeloyl-ACP methyl ester carboxylesterase/DNA-binding CsgD family transcriptional regulator
MRPETRYAKSGELSIAYQVHGSGPTDLLFVQGFVSNIDVAWEEPHLAQYLNRLASFSRLIIFDKRGTGLSDPSPTAPTFAQRMDDIRAVLEAAGSQRAALLGVSEGGPLSIVYACANPEKTSALILYGSYARWMADPDYPWGRTREQYEDFLASIERSWASGEPWIRHNPTVLANERYQAWWGRYLRSSASPAMAAALVRMNAQIDVRQFLGHVSVPTLVLHRSKEKWFDIGNGRYLADHIPGAKLIELPGVDHVPWVGDAEAVLIEIEKFLVGSRPRSRSARFSMGVGSLTQRESEIVQLALSGGTASDIARRLYISERTVESHLANAYIKLGVRSRVELARRAAEFGF